MNRSPTAALRNNPFGLRQQSGPLLTAQRRGLSELAADRLWIYSMDNVRLAGADRGWSQDSVQSYYWTWNTVQPGEVWSDVVRRLMQDSEPNQNLEAVVTWEFDRGPFIERHQRSAQQPFADSEKEMLLKRYKELNSQYYAGKLTAEQEEELGRIESELDELDAKDADLVDATARVEKGYEALENGLAKINSILDELLSA